MRNLLFALFAFIVSINGVFAQDADAKEAFDRFSTELLRLDSISGSYVGLTTMPTLSASVAT